MWGGGTPRSKITPQCPARKGRNCYCSRLCKEQTGKVSGASGCGQSGIWVWMCLFNTQVEFEWSGQLAIGIGSQGTGQGGDRHTHMHVYVHIRVISLYLKVKTMTLRSRWKGGSHRALRDVTIYQVRKLRKLQRLRGREP